MKILKNFLYIKEGNEEAETKETIKAEIKEIKDNMLTDAEAGSSDKIKLEEFLTDEIKGKIKKIINLKIKKMLLSNNVESIDEAMEKYKERAIRTPSDHKKQITNYMDFKLSMLYQFKIFKDLGIDYMEELESSSEKDNSINLDSNNLF